MLTDAEIKEFTKRSGPDALVRMLNSSKDDLIRLLYSEINLKNKAYFYLVDKGLMSEFSSYKPEFSEN
jgi:hypothetical protein